MPRLGKVSEHRLTGTGRQDPARLLAFVAAHAVPGVESWDGVTYARSLTLPGGPAVAAVAADNPGYAVTLRLTDPADRHAALVRLRHLLTLDPDVAGAEEHLARDALLAPLVAARPGLRPPGSVDHAETLIRTVIGQQVSLAGARTLGARLVSRHGQRLPAWLAETPGVTHVWPGAAVIAALNPTDASLAMPAARARTVVATAAAVAPAGRLPSPSDLLAIPGIGAWTCGYVALRCRADPDVFLPGDLAARRALQRLGLPVTTQRAVASTAEAWRPYRSLALMHLWADYLVL